MLIQLDLRPAPAAPPAPCATGHASSAPRRRGEGAARQGLENGTKEKGFQMILDDFRFRSF